MLNLTNPVAFSKDENDHVSSVLKLKDAKGNLLSGSQMWDKGDAATKGVKRHVNQHCLEQQRCKCVYCETLLQKGENFIEHFAPKGLYRDFTFEPLNLTVSCGRCNSTSIRGERDTIKNKPFKKNYTDNEFAIVHPYLDNADEHIVFDDDTRTIFDKDKCSEKGMATIEFFQWDAIDARLKRLNESPYRLTDEEVVEMIRTISTYK